MATAKKTKEKQILEIDIPQEFDFIEWAERIQKALKDKKYEVRFKDRPKELWGSDPLIPQTQEHFDAMMEYLSHYDDITCDVETNGLSYVDPNIRICGHVLTAGERSYYVPIRHITNEPQLDADYVTEVLKREIYHNPKKTLNFHNAVYDYNQMLKDGIDLSPRFKDGTLVDTQILFWLLDENQAKDPRYYEIIPGQPARPTKYIQGLTGHAAAANRKGYKVLEGFSLKVLAPKFVGTPMTKFDDIMELIGFDRLPIHFGGAYARVDGIATKALKDNGYPKLIQEKLIQAFEKVEMPFVRTNANMQRRGMGINFTALDRLDNRLQEEVDRLKAELFAVTGPFKLTSNKQLAVLFHEQMGLPVLAKTESGNPQFNEEAMDLYEEYLTEHAEQFGDRAKMPQIIIRIKKMEKILNTYIHGKKGLRPNIDVDGRVHGSLFQTGTQTGRLAAGKPNLQNLPAKPIFVDTLNRDTMIKMRNEIGDLEINKRFDFSVIFKDERGEPLDMEDGWEDKCVEVVEAWGFRDVFSEKGYTPENREKYKAQYPRFGEIDAYVDENGKLVTIDICSFSNSDQEFVLTVGDYSQMELRMMAHLANATSMIEAYLTGVDVHKKTGSDVFEVPLEEVTKDQRQTSKAINFGLIYGKTDYGFATDWYHKEPDFYAPSNWHPSGKEPSKKYLTMARGFIDKYFEAYPDVKTYIDSRQEMAGRNGYVRSITGRKRRLPGIFSENNSERNRAKRQSVNAIDQGSSADYLKISMNKMEDESHKLAKEGKFLFQIMTVHDEVINLTQKHFSPAAEKLMTEIMTTTVKLRCPVEMDPTTVHTYGSAK